MFARSQKSAPCTEPGDIFPSVGSQEGRRTLGVGSGVTVYSPGDWEGAHLPALVGRAVVRVMLGDVCVDSAQSQLPVLRG